MTVIRVPNPDAPVCVDRKHAQNTSLSLGARGLMLFIEAQDDQYDLDRVWTEASTADVDGVLVVDEYVHELIACGFLQGISS